MFHDWENATVISFLTLTAVIPPLLFIEATFPKVPTPFVARLRGLAFLCASLPIYAATNVLLLHFFSPSPLAVIDLRGLPFAPALGLLLALILGDFWFYWMHRAQHRFFWRFHSIHHAIENVSATNSYHHFTEGLFQAAFMTLPGMVFVRQVDALWLIAPLAWAQGIYLHSTTGLHLGPLRYLVGDNLFHRIHHSTDRAHFDKNFSGFSPIWDLVFGTAHFPDRREWPSTGLADRRETITTWDWLSRPFRF